ncbi:MAG: aldo/keto reductase, partial [Solirubrobacteraceae bacterium]
MLEVWAWRRAGVDKECALTSRSSTEKSRTTRTSLMNRRRLGSRGLEVSAEGLGCMGMTWAYGAGDERSGEATIHRALELGITFLDTAEAYGPYTNEELVGRAIAGRRNEFEIATKFGFVINPDAPNDRATDGSPENARRACEGSLKRLGVEHIDLFYQHRVDTRYTIRSNTNACSTPIELRPRRRLACARMTSTAREPSRRRNPAMRQHGCDLEPADRLVLGRGACGPDRPPRARGSCVARARIPAQVCG